MAAADTPGRLLRQWVALLLAPCAWVVALGVLFALTRDACVRDTRTPMWLVLAACVALAVTGAVVAGRSAPVPENGGGVDRAQFLRRVALGLSAMFLLVLLVMMVPLLMLDSCRT
jgi:hypothetical protein